MQGVQQEADRLFSHLMNVDCDFTQKWSYEKCLELAPLTLKINQLKIEKNAVILAHSYVTADILYGVADFKSDSYALSLKARDLKKDLIVFAGVVFMAETAKILSPQSTVVVPDINSGCSLADSLTGEELKKLKTLHPDAAVVCYINSTAEVKALSDVCVTSSNVYHIIEKLPQEKILFVPDKLMALNIQREMNKKGIKKQIVSSEGTCEVHDQFSPEMIRRERLRYPDLQVVSHPECLPEVTAESDFVGSTGKMIEYVKKSPAKYFMMLTECGLVGSLESEAPDKVFISSCKLCPYMKLNNLEKIIQVMENPRPEQIIDVPKEISLKALASIEKMFEMTNSK
ncbi:MAG: quinolinate synthase NadA [Bacteriovoracaceae bacterium]|nr:quinolinate synthase NadA [Bacteriovoracaceae bacterium]